MTTIAFVILAHRNPRHVARIARLLIAGEGIVAIHYDASSKPEEFSQLRSELGEHAAQVLWPTRVRVGWGEWSVVQATLNALEAIAATGKKPDFVHLMSGSDYPIRPIAEFRDYLERHANDEFIECVDMNDGVWVKGGLTHERYEYRHFFNWKARPHLFEKSWRLQQKLGLKRHFPDGLRPHLGSQWWTLSWAAIEDVLTASHNPRIKSFFKSVWIPDEMFIQSVVATTRVAAATGANLTLYQFTHKGVPVVYANDHAEYLARQPFFFARKISPWADRLRDELDEYVSGARKVAKFADKEIGIRTKEYERFIENRRRPTPGVRLLGYEKDHWLGDLAYQKEPIIAIYGASHRELRMISALLTEHTRVVCHGALFRPDRIEFVEDADSYAGYRSDDVDLRDDRRTTFLHDVASEVAPPGVVGFLAPWTMDEHIRDRMVWCKFSRNLIVRGNVLLAFEEYQERQRAAAEKELRIDADKASGVAVASKPATPQMFQEFERALNDYYCKLNRQLKDASAMYREFNLMGSHWIEHLERSLYAAQGYEGEPQFVGQFEQEQPLPPRVSDVASARRLIDFIPDNRLRLAHIMALIENDGIVDYPFVLIFGASREELRFVADILERLGVFAINDIADRGSAIAATAASEPAFFRELAAAVRRERRDDRIPCLIAPWDVAPVASDLLRHDQARAIIVRGNMFRSMDQAQADNAGRRRSAAFDHPDWAETRPRTKTPTAFMNSYKRFYGKLRAECTAAKSTFVEIDLMKKDWLGSLLDFVEAQTLIDRKDLYAMCRDLALQRAGELSRPAPSHVCVVEVIGLIVDDESRAGHMRALRAGMTDPSL